MKKHRRKRFIEIYFVLYLASLILLIPDKRREEHRATGVIMSLLQSSFSVHPERTTMLCRVVSKGDSIAVVTCDSMNTIYYSGAMRDVHYDFQIEDISYKQHIRLTSAGETNTQLFHLTGDIEQGNMHFTWTPPTKERMNRLFKVHVTATATPILPQTLSDDQQDYIRQLLGADTTIRLTSETEFTVAMLYVDGGSGNPNTLVTLNQQALSLNDSLTQQKIRELAEQIAASRQQAIPPPGQFTLQPRYEPNLTTLAYQEWENRITVYGADPSRDLLGTPTVTGGSAYLKIEGNEIVVRGTAPATGLTTYQVTAQRASDKKEVSVMFGVIAKQLSNPNVPTQMYPGVSYSINPGLPFINSSQATAVLRDDKDNSRATSLQGEPFSFTPSVSDTGKTLYLDRMLNGKKIGQSVGITVNNFPTPEIIDISKMENGSIRIRTRGYGMQTDNQSRVKLETTGLQGKVQEMFGDHEYNKQYNVHLQVFVIPPQQNTITVRAINGYKRYSQQREVRYNDN